MKVIRIVVAVLLLVVAFANTDEGAKAIGIALAGPLDFDGQSVYASAVSHAAASYTVPIVCIVVAALYLLPLLGKRTQAD